VTSSSLSSFPAPSPVTPITAITKRTTAIILEVFRSVNVLSLLSEANQSSFCKHVLSRIFCTVIYILLFVQFIQLS
jgi:hypothetical protein